MPVQFLPTRCPRCRLGALLVEDDEYTGRVQATCLLCARPIDLGRRVGMVGAPRLPQWLRAAG